MNIAFSKIIKIGERQWEFNFRKVPRTELPTFYGDVTGERGVRIAFTIYQVENQSWRIEGQGLPLWMVAGENKIGEAIEEEMQRLSTGIKK